MFMKDVDNSNKSIEKDVEKQIILNKERIEYWLSQGAIPSDTVSQILLRNGIKTKYAEQKEARLKKAREIAAKKGKLFNKAQKVAAQKAAEAAAAEAEAKKKAEEEKAKAEAEAKKKAEEEKAKAEAEAEAAKAAEEAKAAAEADNTATESE